MDYKKKYNQAEEIIYLNYKIRRNTTPQTYKLHLIIHQQLQQCEWYFGLNMISALFIIVRIHSTTNLKSYEQAKNIFNPANTQSSSEESLNVKRRTFIDMCPLFT